MKYSNFKKYFNYDVKFEKLLNHNNKCLKQSVGKDNYILILFSSSSLLVLYTLLNSGLKYSFIQYLYFIYMLDCKGKETNQKPVKQIRVYLNEINNIKQNKLFKINMFEKKEYISEVYYLKRLIRKNHQLITNKKDFVILLNHIFSNINNDISLIVPYIRLIKYCYDIYYINNIKLFKLYNNNNSNNNDNYNKDDLNCYIEEFRINFCKLSECLENELINILESNYIEELIALKWLEDNLNNYYRRCNKDVYLNKFNNYYKCIPNIIKF